MSYFPFFVDIEDADALIVGGGKVALRKVQKLLPYGPRITVVAPEIDPELEALEGPVFIHEAFADGRLEGRAFVIAATNDPALNHHIARLCGERKIPVNVVDDQAYCSFIFPSLVKSGEVSIGISTGGASPSAAVYLRERIEEILPAELADIVDFLDDLRPRFKAVLPSERARTEIYKELLGACLTLGRAMTAAELEKFLQDKGFDQ